MTIESEEAKKRTARREAVRDDGAVEVASAADRNDSATEWPSVNGTAGTV